VRVASRLAGQLVERLERGRRVGRTLWRGGRGPVLAAVAGGWFLSLGVRMTYPAVLPELRAAYGLDLSTAGLLVSGLWVAYAVGQLPGGMLDDRIGGGRVLVASTGVSALAVAGVAAAGSVPVLFGATLAFGFATALYGVSRFTILSRLYPDNDGTAVGLTMAAGDLGNALLPPVAGVLTVAVAWQAGIGFAAPLFLVAAAALWLVVVDGPDGGLAGIGEREAEGEGEDGNAGGDGKPDTDADAAADGSAGAGNGSPSPGGVGAVARALRRRPVAAVTAVQTLSYCVWQAFTAFYPTYLIETKAVPPATATLLFGGFFALGILVKPLTGAAYDAYGLRRSLPALLATVAAAMALVPFAEGLPAIVGVTALASSLLGYGSVTLTFLTDALPAEGRGTTLGALRAGYMTVGAASPTVVGLLADAGRFDDAFLLMAVVAATAAGLTRLVPAGGAGGTAPGN